MATEDPLEGNDYPAPGFTRGSVQNQDPSRAVVVVLGEMNPDIVVTDVPALSFRQREDITGPTTLTVGSSVAILASGLVRLGFLHGRLQSAELDEALRLGVAAGTLSTRCGGGVDGQATSDEAHELAGRLTPSIHTTADEPVLASTSYEQRNPQ
jgi:hypothetical protein